LTTFSDTTLSQILDALYEAPLDPPRWEHFLKVTAQAVAGNASAIFMIDSENAQSSVRAQWGLDPAATRQYEKDYGGGGPWFHAASRSQDWIGPSEHFVPFSELKKTSFYNELIAPCEIPHALLAMIERGPSRIVSLSIYRSPQAGPFDENHLNVVRFLKPHIQRAYRLHREFAAVRHEKMGLHAALDSMTLAVILLGEDLRVAVMNQAAERLVAENDGLLATKHGLQAARSEESAQLQKLVAQAGLAAGGKGLNAGGAMNVSRSSRPPLYLLVSPVRGMELGGKQSVRAIVFVADPTQRIRPAQEVLQFLFGLTAAESRLALLLADGNSPTEIAGVLAVSKNTLKSQLASIYTKTGTSRQAQLVRLLLQISVHPEP
jgi:DNA-binding CsgD family transcriptional regulator